jgi:hypothetical protein
VVFVCKTFADVSVRASIGKAAMQDKQRRVRRIAKRSNVDEALAPSHINRNAWQAAVLVDCGWHKRANGIKALASVYAAQKRQEQAKVSHRLGLKRCAQSSGAMQSFAFTFGKKSLGR